jgi:RNA polymerase primary sigma factor
VLQGEEEARLLALAVHGDRSARDRLVVSNLRFVLKLALIFRNPDMPVADLVNEGCLGLIRAVETFEPGRGVRFLTYAVWWVRSSMTRAVDRTGAMVRAPGKSASKRPEAIRSIPVFVALEEADGPSAWPAAGGCEEGGFRDRLSPGLSASCGGDASPAQVSLLLLAALPPREAEVLRWLHGLDHRPMQSLRQLGAILGISHQRVRQLRDQAFRRLRDAGLLKDGELRPPYRGER